MLDLEFHISIFEIYHVVENEYATLSNMNCLKGSLPNLNYIINLEIQNINFEIHHIVKKCMSY